MSLGESGEIHIEMRVHLVTAHVLHRLIELLETVNNRRRCLNRNDGLFQLLPGLFLVVVGQARLGCNGE